MQGKKDRNLGSGNCRWQKAANSKRDGQRLNGNDLIDGSEIEGIYVREEKQDRYSDGSYARSVSIHESLLVK